MLSILYVLQLLLSSQTITYARNTEFIVEHLTKDEISPITKYNFTNLNEVVSNAVSNTRSSEIKDLCSKAKTQVPEDSVILTYANSADFKIIELQYSSMDIFTPGLQACLAAQYIVVCIDIQCQEQCKLAGYPNCALVDVPTLETFSVQFTKGFYLFSFFKYEMIVEVLRNVNELFFFDADVFILKNPWLDDNGLFKLLPDGSRETPTYDFMFQREHGYNFDCGPSDINGGQYYLRRTEAVSQFLSNMMGYRDEILTFNESKFDQDYAPAALNDTQVKACGLNHYLFVSGRQVFITKSNDHIPISNLVTFHFNGLKGVSRLHRMTDMTARLRASETSATVGSLFMAQDYVKDDTMS